MIGSRRSSSRPSPPSASPAHENAIKKIISHVLDSVANRERFDLVADVARPIPARVIGSMLGTPAEDDEKLVHWTNVFTAFEDPVIREQWKDTPAVVNEIVEYVNNRLARRRGSGGDQLLDAMMDAEVEGSTNWNSPRSSSC
jgi:cytochrome P450